MRRTLIKLLRKALNKYIAFSLTSALCLCILCYFANNLPLFTGENLDQQFLTQYVCEKIGFSERINYDDALFVNVSYDKELVDVNDSCTGKRIGNTDIVDRKKLGRFLEMLQDNPNYKYIILDILFCKDDVSPADDELFNTIASIDKIVIANHDSVELSRTFLVDKSALTEYYSTITATNFCRYEYIRPNGDRRYLPLKVYEDMNPSRKITRYGGEYMSLYFSEGKLCQNSLFLTFDSTPFGKWLQNNDTIFSDDGQKIISIRHSRKSVYKELGYDYIDCFDTLQLKKGWSREYFSSLCVAPDTEDKYVIIGNFTEDIHDTYVGSKPGAFILYRALKSLEQGKHLVKFNHILEWFFIYFLIIIMIVKNKSLTSFMPSPNKPLLRFIYFILDVFTFSTFLFCFEIIDYICTQEVKSLTIPILFFTLLKLFFHYKNYSKYEII